MTEPRATRAELCSNSKRDWSGESRAVLRQSATTAAGRRLRGVDRVALIRAPYPTAG